MKLAAFPSNPGRRDRPSDSTLHRNVIPGVLAAIGLIIVLAGGILIGKTSLGVWVIAGAIAVMLGLCIIIRPQIGVYILVIFVFLNLSDILEVQFNIASINKVVVGLLLISVLANRLVYHRQRFVFGRVEILIAIYGFVTLLSTLLADDRAVAVLTFSNWVKDFIILIVIVQLCDNETFWKRLQWMVILSAAFLSALSCYQMLTRNFDNTFYGLANSPVHEIVSGFDSQRLSGPLTDPNFYGQILLTAFPLAFYRLLTERRMRLRVVGGVCSLLILGATMFTYSRGSFIAISVVGLLIAYERKYNMVRLILGFTIIFAIVTPFLPSGYLDRILTLQDIIPTDLNMQAERSFRGRSSEMIVATRMFSDYPIIGIGLANYEAHYLQYSALVGLDDRFEPREAHDLYLEIAAETGILGLLSFSAVIVALFSGLWRAKRRLRQMRRQDLIPWVSAVEYSLTAYLVTSIFLHGAYVRYLWLTISLAAGSLVLIEILSRQARAALKAEAEKADKLNAGLYSDTPQLMGVNAAE